MVPKDRAVFIGRPIEILYMKRTSKCIVDCRSGCLKPFLSGAPCQKKILYCSAAPVGAPCQVSSALILLLWCVYLSYIHWDQIVNCTGHYASNGMSHTCMVKSCSTCICFMTEEGISTIYGTLNVLKLLCIYSHPVTAVSISAIKSAELTMCVQSAQPVISLTWKAE